MNKFLYSKFYSIFLISEFYSDFQLDLFLFKDCPKIGHTFILNKRLVFLNDFSFELHELKRFAFFLLEQF